ncbi:MAG TPA: SPOR domain-containing protein [Edaphobacter sp.]|nr:SPOR domain-containing protein [Edaphobacter sp.]
MNTRYSRDSEVDDDEQYGERDREISLGTTFILGIFFALVLVCAIFFAFGYSMGRRSASPAAGVTAAPVAETSAAKPASGVPAAQGNATSSGMGDASSQTGSASAQSVDQTADNGDPSNDPSGDSAPALVPVSATPKPASAVVLPTKPAVRSATETASRAVPAAAAAAPGAHLPVVQVAAISRQGDANMLLSALRRKGYNASVHQVPQDKLFHIQLGPFATRKDAEAMRQKLIGDGYNAIVK